MDKELKQLLELSGITPKATVTESIDVRAKVAGDFRNGYDDQHKSDGEDYFPSGADSNVTDYAGPASAKHGDNPLQKAMVEVEVDEILESTNNDKAIMEQKQIHQDLVYAYRKFKQ